MTETNDVGTAPRPEPDESYSTAAGSSNLRVEAEKRTPADLIMAAGMNRHRTGLALLRLASEWDRSAKPAAPTRQKIEALAASYALEPAELDGKPNPDGGLVCWRNPKGWYEWRKPMELAEEEAVHWYQHELGLLLQRLKTLPQVREALYAYLATLGAREPQHVVAQVLLWWLSPRCDVCGGVGRRVVNSRLTSRLCGGCHGTGERPLPHAGEGAGGAYGRVLLRHIRECRKDAVQELKQRTRGSKRERPRQVFPTIEIGQRWRSRDGHLWDVLSVSVDDRTGREVFRAEAAGRLETPRQYRRDGRLTTRGPLSEPSGSDLVSLIGRSPVA